MNIGIIIDDTIKRYGGVQRYVLDLYRYIHENTSHNVVILTGKNDSIPKQDALEKVDYIETGRTITPPTFIRNLINQASTSIPFYSSKKEVQQILDKYDFDVLHIQAPFSPFLSGQFIKYAKQKTKIAITFHIIPTQIAKFRYDLQIYRFIIKPFIKRINGCIVVSHNALKYAQTVFKEKKFVVIPNAVWSADYINQDSTQFNDPDKQKIKLLFLGRLDARKGIFEALRIYKNLSKKYHNIVLWVIGKGPQDEECRQYVREHKLSVRFWGAASEDEKRMIMKASDIYIAPANGGESFGIVLIEAMSAGLPIVAYNNEGYKEVLNGTKNFVVSVGDLVQLEEKVELLISDERLRNEVGEQNISDVKKFDWSEVGRKIVEYYENL